MNLARAFQKGRKLILLLIAAVIFVPAPALADTLPYFKVFGGGVWAGGWFDNNTTCDTGANYQDPNFKSVSQGFLTTDSRYGGIMAYSKENGAGHYAGGASGDFGVFALGLVEGQDSSDWGFASAGRLASGSASPYDKDYLSFANAGDNSAKWGGSLQGSVRQAHCIPDYYSKLSGASASNISSSNLNSVASSSGVYRASAVNGSTPWVVNNSAVNIPAGTDLTLYVNGPAYIGGNISYPANNSLTVDHVPKFALVVKGSIYISPSVTHLDGVYIAQPDLSDAAPVKDDTGVIWTCHGNNTALPPSTYPPASCNSQLTVNGSLIAKRVNFLRSKGTVQSSGANETSSSGNIAEVINYTPAMVVNGPFFNPGGGSLKIESLVNLPPVF